MNDAIARQPRGNYFYAGWLLLAGALGLLAAFSLTMEKINGLTHPDSGASCDFSLLVQCSANLNSQAGAIFGFPNPLLGLMAWPFVLATGVLVLFSVKLPKVWWYGFFLGVTGALIFVSWLQYQSIMVLGTLCPWCMVTWFAVIPTWWATFTHMGSLGLWSKKSIDFFRDFRMYVPVISLVWFGAIALWAQLRLDWLGQF